MNPTLSDASLQELLEQLRRGDVAAAERIFVTYEPYLRLVVRQQLSAALRAKFDSPDIVHSVWVDVLRRFRDAGCRFANANHLRAYLVRATRNRFIDRLRQHQKALDREQRLGSTAEEDLPPSPQPEPAAQLQAEDLWRELLELCLPTHRDVLLLKRQGCALAEIAARTGLHEGSVRRILYDLARRFAARQQTPAPAPDDLGP
jgi:RNA polymerase sigma-70 factor (ECF subfamily)